MENIDRREYVRRTRSLLTTQPWTFYRSSRAFKQVRSDSESSIAGPTNNSMNIPTAMQDYTLVRLLSGRTQTAHHHQRWPNRYATYPTWHIVFSDHDDVLLPWAYRLFLGAVV